MQKFDHLKTLLRDMFQLDRGDLDFGLYRIMQYKAREIEKFLDDDLLPQIREKLALTSEEERARIQKELDDTINQLKKLKAPLEDNPKVASLRAQYKAVTRRGEHDDEADVYNHLANFFARYYSEGDFISQRRYTGGGRSAYLIPYNGEEVKLHWANADQYYIKTTENYAAYCFMVSENVRVRFEIAAADNEKDNIKEAAGKQRRFILAKENNVVTEDGLTIRFEHRLLTEGEKKKYAGRRQQDRINQDTVQRILARVDDDWRALLTTPAPTEANSDRTLLEKHVDRYTAKNSFDYFIHKDLGGFLHRELDMYIKTEVLNLDDFTNDA